MVTQTVPVTHEEVRVEYEPSTDTHGTTNTGGAPQRDPSHQDTSPQQPTVTLYAEKLVTHTERVPVERVTLGIETVTRAAHRDRAHP